MANCFIPCVPKPTNEKYSSKPLCKNVPKEFSIFDNSQQIKRNSVFIKVSTVDSDLFMQKVNTDKGIIAKGMLTRHILLCLILIQVESLTAIYKSSDSSNKDVYDSEFPLVLEVISNFWKEKGAKQGISKGLASEAVDKLVLDNSSYSINSDKSILGLNSGNSQGECAKSSSLWISSLTIYRQPCLYRRG
jgi:hypothetical protein